MEGVQRWGRGRTGVMAVALALGSLAAAPGLLAQEIDTTAALAGEHGRFTDPKDGWFDLSQVLASVHGFFILPVPITEPALGYGLAAGPVFISPRRNEGLEGWSQPDVTAVLGMATTNGTWGLAGGRVMRLVDDRLKLSFGGAYAALNLDFYGLGPLDDDRAVETELESWGGVVRGEWRLGPSSPLWLGAGFTYASVDASLPDSLLAGFEGQTRLAGPRVLARYDGRNNLFTPTRGLYLEGDASINAEAFGGSVDFLTLTGIAMVYHPLGERLFPGIHVQVQATGEDAPFYARPGVVLRGIPRLRYQGQTVTSVEGELRWQFHPRLSALAFGGAGFTDAGNTRLEDQTVGAGGMGVRYLLARAFGLHYGIDVARGPEEWAIYFQLGSAWMRP